MVKNLGTHVKEKHKEELLHILEKYKPILNGGLGNFKGESISLHLKDTEKEKPYHAAPFKVLVAQQDLIREEIARLESLDVIKRVKRSKWAAPIFAIPKKN